MKLKNTYATMSIDDNWDVEKHKAEHESDEHWELRRNFLLEHKTKFPEDELVCLAQVFANIELLGCRYPKETMDLVTELSRDIAAEYREKQKTKLKRTFVKASEAASSKVKGYVAQMSTITEESSKNNKESLKKLNTMELTPKRIKIMSRDVPYGDIILVERPSDIPQNILSWSVHASGGNMDWKYTKMNNICECTIYINSKQVASASSTRQKFAKKEAAVLALDKLRKYYYTIKDKQNWDAKGNMTVMTMEKTKSQEHIPDDNIGKKLMKLMGWNGGGLGKSQQGIVEPVIIKQQLSREGLGLKANSFNMHELKAKCKSTFKEFLMDNMQNDIVFSTDFSSEERAVIHQVAREMGLKSRSHGPINRRRLVISRKIDLRSLVDELKSLGGITEKYELIEPTEKNFSS